MASAVATGVTKTSVELSSSNDASSSSATAAPKKLWGGRFTGAVDPLMEMFNESLSFDKRLSQVDVQGSQAYARALQKINLISQDECDQICKGLDEVATEWSNGKFIIKEGDEDIHTANERRLGEIIGTFIAGKLHTGRSRNDQVATDTRLWLRGEIDKLDAHLRSVIAAGITLAQEHIDILMPGYTHLQPAQPIRFSHWILMHCTALRRDAERLSEIRARVNVMPLGSGALAGHPFGIDRESLAQDLGFEKISVNSLDAVSDRDFIIEFLFWASLTGVHLSRIAEDLIIYGSKEFGYVSFSDAYSTGSSLMPQKKNPDALELLRGKAGRTVGGLTGLLMTLKGIPSTYNKDLQEDKEPLFDAVDTLQGTLPITCGVLSTLTLHPTKMEKALVPEMLATDLADYLVRKGVPFRETHHIAGEAVRMAEEKGVPLSALTNEEVCTLHEEFDVKDVDKVWSFEASVETRNAKGGTAKIAVQTQIDELKEWIEA